MMKSGIVIKEIDVTPLMAERWLLKNTHNRPIYRSSVEAYAREMKLGTWILSPQGISFSTEGILLDGQHRLSAILESGKTVRMFVFYNVPDNIKTEGGVVYTQEIIDAMKPRSVGDRLNLTRGLENANLVCAICAGLLQLCTGSSPKQTPHLVLEVLEIYKSEVKDVIANRTSLKGLSYGPVLATFAFAAKVSKDKTIEFERKYFKGDNLAVDSPILTLRNYILNRKAWKGEWSYRPAIHSASLTALMYHDLGQPLTRIFISRQGLDYFLNKQKKTVNQVLELIKI